MTSLYRYFFLFSFFLFGTNQIWAQVKIETSADKKYYEIRNGLLGIMIPAKGLKDETSGSYPAPIQSFIFANGERSDKTINLLKTPNLPTDMQVTVRTNTKDAIVVAVLYKFKKPEFVYGRKFKGGEAGPGYYSCVITVRKNSPSIIFEEESDFDFSYEVGISGGLNPDQARYRGWSSPSVKEGYEKPGAIYRAENERGYPMDATVDLDYSKPIAFAPLTRWEPAGGEYGTGRYWQVYNSKAGTNANLFGFFQGRPSRLFGSISCGVSLAITEQKESAIKVFSNRLAPDLSWFPKKRFEWAAFISSKKDLLAPEKTQPIAIQMNEWSGLGAKVHGYASGKMKIIPAFYEGAIYMPANKVQQLIQQVKRDDRFYQSMLQLDAYFKFPLDMWRFPDSGVTAVRRLLDRYRNTIKDYTVGEGTYKWANRYWIGAIGFKSTAFEISCLFADKSIKISASQRDTLERFISLLARIAWDNDNAPFQDSSGTNWGPANMAFMYRNNARNFFALLLANDKEFANRAKAVAQQTRKDFEAVIYANGSAIGTPHYMQASIDPVLFTMLQLKQAGVEDQFKNNQRLNRFIDFYTSLLTPPSVRFKSYRKLISFGDGSEENASTFALISAGLHDVDPKKSEQLSFIFENGAPRMNLFGNIAMVTDLTKPHHAQFTGGSTFFPGYVSHFRSGINSPNETAVWILNGDSLSDHRNDDAGEVAMYALNAPLSLSRSSFYYPHATDARIRSVVVPAKMFEGWDKNDQPIAERSTTNRTWPKSASVEFASFKNSSSTTIKMGREGSNWFRQVALVKIDSSRPLIVFYDSLSSKEPMIWTMPFMSDGPVKTPAGEITPEKRVHNDQSLKQLPSSTGSKSLTTGLNAFRFTGQEWKLHPAGGINCDVFLLTRGTQRFSLSQWTTTWQNTAEQVEFRETNGKPYEEGQQYFRLNSSEPVFACIVPYPKNKTGGWNSVQQNNEIALTRGDDRFIISKNGFSYRSANRVVVTSFTNRTFNSNGVTIEGGPAEVDMNDKEMLIRIHGNTGSRKLILPGNYSIGKQETGFSVKREGNSTIVTINYQNKQNGLRSTEIGFTEWKLVKSN